MKKNTVCILILLILSISTSANSVKIATCSFKAYNEACLNCNFNKEGAIDKTCQDSYQSGGKTCLVKAYPGMSAKYLAGKIFGDGCPALQACMDTLKACNRAKCPDKAIDDCKNPACTACYIASDNCAYMASKDCPDKSKCGDKKCDKDKGEDQKTCCMDCGCPEGQECKNQQCIEKQEPEQKPETTPRKPETQYVEPTTYDFITAICGFGLIIPLIGLISVGTYSKIIK